MTFNHKTVKLPELTTETITKKRFYVTPEGNKYPSITTVLSIRKKEGLYAWRKRVGNDVANHIARTASARGTKVHHMCEDYLNNLHVDYPDKFNEHQKDFLPWCLFTQLKGFLDSFVDEIYGQECGLYSDKYKVAGRVDCIAEYKGTLSIIDFKTSTRQRTDDWNENYYIQGSAYAEMFGERTGIEINQVVILVVTEDGTVQEFMRDKKEYLPMLEESVTKWSKVNETPVTITGNVSGDGLSNNTIS